MVKTKRKVSEHFVGIEKKIFRIENRNENLPHQPPEDGSKNF